MIRVTDIHKSFGDNHVLKGFSIDFLPGKTSLIIGQSGSGKTVFMKCMIGLMEVSSGSIFYGDTNFSQLDKKKRKAILKKIGMLFQGSALFDSMTVEGNVRFPLDMFTNWTKKEKMDRVNYVLDRVSLNGANDKFPSEISGGMMKRVGIARAIVLKPSYLFCDEPNSGLDPKTALKIDNLIREITEENNIVTIINTHDMNSVMEIGEQVTYLYFGKKAWEGSSKEILHSDNELLNEFIFANKFLQELRDDMQKK